MVKYRGTIEPYGAIKPSGTELADGEVLRRRADENAVQGYVPANESRTVKYLEYELWIVAAQSNWEGVSGVTGADEYGADAGHPRAWEVVRPTANITNLSYDEYYRLPDDGGSPDDGELIPLHGVTLDSRSQSVTPHLAFARRRLEMFPGIKGLAILGAAKGGTGFDSGEHSGANNWTPGQALYDAMLTDAQTFLDRYPQYQFAGHLTDLLASEPGSVSLATASAALQGMVTDMRDSLRGGDRAVFCCTEITEARRDDDTEGVGHYQDMADAQLDAVEALDRAGYVRVDDLSVVSGDAIHLDQQGLRDMGARAAEVAASVADFGPRRASQAYRMLYDADKGRFADAFGSDARIFNEILETGVDRWDGSTGNVLYTYDGATRTGFDTSMMFPTGDYTIALWFERQVDPVAAGDTEDYFVCGKLTGQAVGNIFSRRFSNHVETGEAIASAVNLTDDGAGALQVSTAAANAVEDFGASTWCHVALTFKDGFFQKYVNGTAEGPLYGDRGSDTGDPADDVAYPNASGPHIVQIGTWGALTGVSGIPQMYMDDIIILPYALSATQVATLHSDGVLPS